jgi:hypothetical protein
MGTDKAGLLVHTFGDGTQSVLQVSESRFDLDGTGALTYVNIDISSEDGTHSITLHRDQFEALIKIGTAIFKREDRK